MLYKLIPDMGLKGLPEDQFESLPSSRCLQIHFTAFGVFFGEEIFTSAVAPSALLRAMADRENQTEWAARCGGLGLAVKMFREAAL